MHHESVGEEKPWVLLLPASRQLFPLNPVALTRAQGSRGRIAAQYRDAMVLDPIYGVRRIEHVHVVGPLGASFGRRLLSRLADAWQISVSLSSPIAYPLQELKSLVMACAAGSRDAGHELPVVADEGRLTAAQTVPEIISALGLPSLEDALDAL